jgi:hypothetical protein
MSNKSLEVFREVYHNCNIGKTVLLVSECVDKEIVFDVYQDIMNLFVKRGLLSLKSYDNLCDSDFNNKVILEI